MRIVRQQMRLHGSLKTSIEEQQLLWYVHILRMEEIRLLKKNIHFVISNYWKDTRPKECIRKKISLRTNLWYVRLASKLVTS